MPTSPPSSPPTSYRWQLTPPQGDPNCSNVDHGGISGDRSTFFWYHGPDQCSHDAEDPVVGHKGTVSVTLEFVFYECKASIYGTQGAADGSDGNGADGTCKKI